MSVVSILVTRSIRNFVFDIFNGLWDTVLDEMIFTLDGFRELLCMMSAQCRG